jgi:hypothetical protein
VPIGFGTDLQYFLMVIMPKFIYMKRADANNENYPNAMVNAKILEMDQKIGSLEPGYLQILLQRMMTQPRMSIL